MAGQDLEKRCTNFKSCRVGKDDELQEELEELPEKLRRLWIKRNFQQFLKEFNTVLLSLDGSDNSDSQRTGISKLNSVLPFLSELGKSFDSEIHQQLNFCYSLCEAYLAGNSNDDLQRRLARSCNRYVLNILCKEQRRFASGNIPRYLKLSKHLLNEDERNEQTLKAEDTLLLESPGNKYIEFMKKLYIYPLSSTTFPRRPGVYFIYYVGETDLYEGSQVSPSTDLPVYVGMSGNDICVRLKDHQRKIRKSSEAGNLKLSDFVVRFMIVDIQYYARRIEGMLIEHFSPVWNSETVKLSFGNANSPDNNWNKYHIQKDRRTIRTMLGLLKID